MTVDRPRRSAAAADQQTANARRQLAEAIRAATGATSAALIAAFATVPRERFLPPGPWHVRDAAGARVTKDAEPAQVYADASIAVDLSRDLYNGQPSTVARWLDALNIAPGDRVLHIGCGSGYYAAILASMVGPEGHVTAIEVDEALAAAAAANLADWPWAEVQHGDGTKGLASNIDVVLVHAGASHVRPEWLDCCGTGARLLVPLTVDFAAMGPTLGKGLTFLLQRHAEGWHAKALSFVAIYSMQSARDAASATALGRAMQGGGWDTVTRLRTDPHDTDADCWCHIKGACLAMRQ